MRYVILSKNIPPWFAPIIRVNKFDGYFVHKLTQVDHPIVGFYYRDRKLTYKLDFHSKRRGYTLVLVKVSGDLNVFEFISLQNHDNLANYLTNFWNAVGDWVGHKSRNVVISQQQELSNKLLLAMNNYEKFNREAGAKLALETKVKKLRQEFVSLTQHPYFLDIQFSSKQITVYTRVIICQPQRVLEEGGSVSYKDENGKDYPLKKIGKYKIVIQYKITDDKRLSISDVRHSVRYYHEGGVGAKFTYTAPHIQGNQCLGNVVDKLNSFIARNDILSFIHLSIDFLRYASTGDTWGKYILDKGADSETGVYNGWGDKRFNVASFNTDVDEKVREEILKGHYPIWQVKGSQIIRDPKGFQKAQDEYVKWRLQSSGSELDVINAQMKAQKQAFHTLLYHNMYAGVGDTIALNREAQRLQRKEIREITEQHESEVQEYELALKKHNSFWKVIGRFFGIGNSELGIPEPEPLYSRLSEFRDIPDLPVPIPEFVLDKINTVDGIMACICPNEHELILKVPIKNGMIQASLVLFENGLQEFPIQLIYWQSNTGRLKSEQIITVENKVQVQASGLLRGWQFERLAKLIVRYCNKISKS